MSGMKFRLQCAGCGATFFATDRKARHCQKCVKKGALKKGAGDTKRQDAKQPLKRSGAAPERGLNREPKPREKPEARRSKTAELTPELREQVAQLYQTQFAGSAAPLDEAVNQISDRLWVTRKTVKQIIGKIIHPDVPITPELRGRIIEAYKGYVERSERPARGRRRSISEAVGVPLRQVMQIVYEWSQSQYNQSPTPELSRQQRFEIEKLYWDEMGRSRYRYSELPAKIADRLGYVTTYQVSRWLDTLHDDRSRFDKIPDAPAEAEQRILEAYNQYLSAPQPPEQGLHATIANQVGGVSGRQVHKVLQQYRYRQRDEYPLK